MNLTERYICKKFYKIMGKTRSCGASADANRETNCKLFLFFLIILLHLGKVPVQTESLSRPSPNWNPLHEVSEFCQDFLLSFFFFLIARNLLVN